MLIIYTVVNFIKLYTREILLYKTMKRVVLFKSSDNSEEYKRIFESDGFLPMFIPVLDFIFINFDKLLKKLEDHESYDGIVITSPRAIDAIVKCSKLKIDNVLEHWKSKHIFVVGESTNKKLKSDLDLYGSGTESGNANNLADFIIKTNETSNFTRKLLFICGSLKSETLPMKLDSQSIALESIVVYETQENEGLYEEIYNLHKDVDIPSNLIFFSPSGVNYVFPILKELDYDFSNSKLVAIGPSTEKRIKDFGFIPHATAKEPTPLAIFACFN